MYKISNWVEYCVTSIPNKRGFALDLACGLGRHSIYLSYLGFKVLSVDINKDHLNSFSGTNIKKLLKDIENKENWPLTKIKFDIIVVTNFLNRSIFPLILNSLALGGFLIYETFSEGQQKIGKPKNPNFILQPKELLSLCSTTSLIAYEEICAINPSNHSFKQRIFSCNVR